MDFKKLLNEMAKQKISQRELSRRLGLSKNTVNAKFNGKGHFNTEQVSNICEILEINDLQKRAEIFLSDSSHK